MNLRRPSLNYCGIIVGKLASHYIQSAIYLNKHDAGSGIDHYISYTNMASTLNPPMSGLDFLSALTSHFEPRVQKGLICSKLQSM
jgi:hypothetical protein